MSTLLDQINGVNVKTTTKPSGSSLLSQILSQPINPKVTQYRQEQVAYDQANQKANSFGGLLKGTLGGIVGIGKTFLNDTWQVYQQTPQKLVEDIKAGAEEKTILKGSLKSGGRVAGDVANAIFAPIGSAIGAVLGQSGGQKLIDKTGEVIADHSGITDIPAFQRFAMTHPNAAEDFNRLLVLVLSKGEKGRINPKAVLEETRAVASKIIGQASPLNAEVNPNFGKVVPETYAKAPVQAPITPKTAPETTIAPKVDNTGTQEVRQVMEGLSTGYRSADVIKIMENLYQKNPSGRFTPQEISIEASNFEPIKQGKMLAGNVPVESLIKQFKTKNPAIDTQPNFRGTPETQIKSKVVKVSSEQLPVGEGETQISRLEARMKEKLDSVSPEKAKEAGISTFEQMNKKEQLQKASEYVSKNPDEALQVLKGEIPAPKDLLHNSIALALEAQAEITGNAELISKLASLRSTRFGQEISILTEADPLNVVSQTRGIEIARENAIMKKKGKTVSKAKKDVNTEIDKTIKEERTLAQIKVAEAEKLLDTLVC